MMQMECVFQDLGRTYTIGWLRLAEIAKQDEFAHWCILIKVVKCKKRFILDCCVLWKIKHFFPLITKNV